MGGRSWGQTGKGPSSSSGWEVPRDLYCVTQACVLDLSGPFQQGTWNSLAKFCSFDSLPKA